jgi:toxin YxiD
MVPIVGLGATAAKLAEKADNVFEVTSDLAKMESKVTVKGVNNMSEFFSEGFGKSIKRDLSKTEIIYDGQSIYKVTNKTDNEYMKKGYGVYLDALHKDHLEVFDKQGVVRYVLNLDSGLDADKTEKAIGRIVKGWK